jgi:hypothetical protein
VSCCCTFYCADTGKTVMFCTTTGEAIPVTPCKPLITATGGYTPCQLAQGLPGQCKQGAGGAQGFPSCIKGPGLTVNKCQVKTGITCDVLGWLGCHVTEPASKFWNCDVKKTFAALPSIWTILFIVFILFLVVVFVYGYAKSR